MTFLQFYLKWLYEHGLFENDAAAVMEKVMAEDTMNGRWHDKTDDYPAVMKVAVGLSVKRGAAEWLNANKPNHWALPMFDDEKAAALGIKS